MLEEYTYQEQPSGRTDTLVKALEKIEKLEKQLAIAVEVLKYYENKRKCQKALEQIKEVENGNLSGNKRTTKRKSVRNV